MNAPFQRYSSVGFSIGATFPLPDSTYFVSSVRSFQTVCYETVSVNLCRLCIPLSVSIWTHVSRWVAGDDTTSRTTASCSSARRKSLSADRRIPPPCNLVLARRGEQVGAERKGLTQEEAMGRGPHLPSHAVGNGGMAGQPSPPRATQHAASDGVFFLSNGEAVTPVAFHINEISSVSHDTCKIRCIPWLCSSVFGVKIFGLVGSRRTSKNFHGLELNIFSSMC